MSRRLALSILATLGCSSPPAEPPRDAAADAFVLPSACDPAWLFCDDFEDGDAGWTVAGDVAVIASADGPSPSALRARVDGSGTPVALSTTVMSATEQHVRFWLRLPADAAPTSFRLVELGEPGTENASWLGMVRRSDGVWQPQIGQALPTGAGGGPGGLSTVPGDTWMCVEVGIANQDVGGLTGTVVTVRFARATGVTITEGGSGTGLGGVDLGAYGSLRFGVLGPHSSESPDPIVGPLELGLDDLALDDVRIVCGS